MLDRGLTGERIAEALVLLPETVVGCACEPSPGDNAMRRLDAKTRVHAVR